MDNNWINTEKALPEDSQPVSIVLMHDGLLCSGSGYYSEGAWYDCTYSFKGLEKQQLKRSEVLLWKPK